MAFKEKIESKRAILQKQAKNQAEKVIKQTLKARDDNIF